MGPPDPQVPLPQTCHWTGYNVARYISEMRSPWLTAVLAVSLLAACAPGADRESAGVRWTGFPHLPSAFAPAANPPALPPTGPVGRGAMLVQTNAGILLVLEDGTQYRLPPTPPGEGRLGTLLASLSPTGRWLGYRRGAHERDTVYRVRDLGGTRVTEFDGDPVLWTPDGRFLLAQARTVADRTVAGADALIVDVLTGAVRVVPNAIPVGGLLPDGDVLTTAAHLRVGGAQPDDECWCPQGGWTVSPDGSRLSTVVRYEAGLIPGTGVKSAVADNHPVAILVADRATGVQHPLVDLPTGDDAFWALAADTGAGLLLHRRTGATTFSYALVLVDPAVGTPEVVYPSALDLVVPGEVLRTGE
jgi:hypothetical protein